MNSKGAPMVMDGGNAMSQIFRQWDDKFCRFTYWGVNIPMSMYCQTVGTTPFEGQENRPRQAFTPPSKEGVGSEQYTGLKDKDGQLVFVGDRVQFTKNANFTIIWDKERCGFYGIDDNGVDYLITCLVHMIKKHGVGKVIGHIHKEGNK